MASPDVQAMDLHEVGAYLYLLCNAWSQDRHGCLPDDDRKLRAWSHMTRDQWAESRDILLSKFPIIEDGVRGNIRMIHEAGKQERFNKAQKDRIDAAWEKRRNNTENIPSVSENIPPVEIGKASVLPSVSVSVSSKNIKPLASQVEEIYLAYPRKESKGNALKAIEKALRSVDGEILLSKVKRFSQVCQKLGTEKQFIPHPASWFNGMRWEDESLLTSDDLYREATTEDNLWGDIGAASA